MPELPEVETIRKGLELGIVGHVIKAVQVLYEKTFLAPDAVINSVVNEQTVKHVDRRAKVLIWELGNGYSLLFHLKMTGQVVLVKADGERFAGGHPTASMASALPDRSTRVVFNLDSGDKVFFNDQRKFGWIKLVETANIELDSLISRLGPEPLSAAFTVENLALKLKRHARAPIKAVILDQSTAAGVGNIYADESLNLAKIHPARLAGSLNPTEVKRLHKSIKTILALGIEHGGTSFTHYVNALGGKGDYLEHSRVFRKQGKPCLVCGSIIEKARIAGRGTHFCPRCQPR
jgi:formamidopyrimidine-DNA glycosylase